jgi:hypothetical protein
MREEKSERRKGREDRGRGGRKVEKEGERGRRGSRGRAEILDVPSKMSIVTLRTVHNSGLLLRTPKCRASFVWTSLTQNLTP